MGVRSGGYVIAMGISRLVRIVRDQADVYKRQGCEESTRKHQEPYRSYTIFLSHIPLDRWFNAKT